jgi:hypothetical protein
MRRCAARARAVTLLAATLLAPARAPADDGSATPPATNASAAGARDAPATGPETPAAGETAAGDPATPADPETPAADSTSTPAADSDRGPSSTGGIAGTTVSADDPAAKRAQTDLEGEVLDRRAAVPERLPPLQRAGWWTMFGAVALATGGAIFSGLAERQEDEAERLALGFDLETGRRTEYEQVADRYQRILDRGRTDQAVSRGLLIGAGAAFAASVTLFAVQAARSRTEGRAGGADRRGSATVRPGVGAGGFEVAF